MTDPATIRRILEAIAEGQTKALICGGMKGRQYVGGKIVSNGRLNALIAQHPRLGKRITRGLEKNANAANATARRRLIAAPALLRNDGHDAFGAIQAATRHLAEPLQGTIQSDLWLDIAEGRLKLQDIPDAVHAAVTRHHRTEKHSVMSRWGNRSLDAPIGEDGFSLLDTIADAGAWSPITMNTGRHVSTRSTRI